MNNLSAVVLTFLILIIIIIVCDDITKSVLLAGITANFFVIFYYIHEMSNNSPKPANAGAKQNNIAPNDDSLSTGTEGFSDYTDKLIYPYERNNQRLKFQDDQRLKFQDDQRSGYENMDDSGKFIDEQTDISVNSNQNTVLEYDPTLTDDLAMYGKDYVDYSRIRAGTNDPYAQLRPIDSQYTNFPDTYDELANTIDAKNTSLGRRRARDKRCKTALVKKNADYYKYHFGNELVDSENRVWWGRDEF